MPGRCPPGGGLGQRCALTETEKKVRLGCAVVLSAQQTASVTGDCMQNHSKNNFFIYPTRGVCPPEIHFKIVESRVCDLRFVGGGCPGNASLVSRLIDNRPVDEILQLLQGIECRNGTSCPDQLARALYDALSGTLRPADTFRLYTDPQPRSSIALIGDLSGNCQALERIIQHLGDSAFDIACIAGNLTGHRLENQALIKAIRKNNFLAIQGEQDWQYARKTEGASFPAMDTRDRDWLARLPQVVRFKLAGRCGVIFFGDYLQCIPGYSDYEPFALEMNMVCGLTDFMRDESVFPALQAMTSQLQADIIVFSQTRQWGHWHVDGRDFISLGAAVDGNELAWGWLASSGNGIRFDIMRKPL